MAQQKRAPDFEDWLATIPGAQRTGKTTAIAPCVSPEHDDAHPSFGFSVGQRYPVVANCLSEGCQWDDVRTGLAALGLSTVGVGRPKNRTRTVQRNVRATETVQYLPLENQDRPYSFHDQLMARPESDFYRFLTIERGLQPETLRRFYIGTDSQRITIPVRVSGGSKWHNVRRYLPRVVKNKLLNTPGHGTVSLAFTEALEGNTLPVLFCEGELDALLANQEGAGRFVAVTGTGGAPNVPKDLTPLRGREVVIAYDADDAGRAGAAKLADALRNLE